MRSLPINLEPGPPVSPVAAVAHVGLFIAGLAVFLGLVRGVLFVDPVVEVEQSRRPLLLSEHFEANVDEFDGVFIGSSRFFRGIDPAAFDRRAESSGQPVRTFNYSMNGMRMPEIIARADWILEHAPKKLRWLFVELTSLDPAFRPDNRRGRRMIAWHTARATLDCLRVIGASDRTPRAMFDEALPHLAEFGYRSTNLGLGPIAAEQWLGTARLEPTLDYFDGYETYEEEEQRKRAARGNKKAGQPSKRAAVGANRRDDFSDSQASVLSRFIARVEAAGVELIFVRAPRSPRDRTARRAKQSGMSTPLLAYDSPTMFPELDGDELYRDAGHLNSAGAEVFSQRLATDFLALIAESGDE